jgi:hypothetical protein
MKRIIRLTESDLTRIVRRVIAEAETSGPGKTPMVDGGKQEVGGNVLIVLSQPVVTGGAGYKGTPSVQIKFNGIVAKMDGTVVRKGNLVGYGICGNVANQGGSIDFAPSNLSLVGTNDVAEGGNLFSFKNNGVIGSAARNYCSSKGVKTMGPGVSYDTAADAREVYKNIA